MSTEDDLHDDDGPDAGGDAALAAEYVLRLLPERERTEFEARLAVEPALAAEVGFWEARFAEFAMAEIPPVAPPPQLRTWVEAELFGARPERRRRGRVWLSFGVGTLFGGAAVALAAAALLFIQTGLRLPQGLPPGLLPGAPPAYVAQIASTEADMVVLARTAAGGRAGLLEVSMLRAAPPEGRVLELWLIAGDRAPISLGVLPPSGRAAVPLGPALASLLRGGVLAVSDEPPGGSPGDGPTGDVRATAELTEL